MPHPPLVESALNRFRSEFALESMNESGGNGYVLVGRHTILERPAVIKIYNCETGDNAEPSILASLEHENIVKIFHACRDEESDSMCYFMEACDNDLSGISIHSGYSTSLLLEILRGLLTALAHMHTKTPPAIHGDIKHENVLLKCNVAKLCDFGSAFELNAEENRIPAGSILFKPPEVFYNTPDYSVVSDQYQVGVLGYSLFGGTLLQDYISYLSKGQQAKLRSLALGYERSVFIDTILAQRISAGSILRWRSLPSFTSNRVLRILRQATQINPNERFKSASSMLIELNNIRRQFIDWTLCSDSELLAEYASKRYRLHNDARHWSAYSSSSTGGWRKIHTTKDTTLDGCIHKFRAAIKADRDT